MSGVNNRTSQVDPSGSRPRARIVSQTPRDFRIDSNMERMDMFLLAGTMGVLIGLSVVVGLGMQHDLEQLQRHEIDDIIYQEDLQKKAREEFLASERGRGSQTEPPTPS